MQRHDHEEIVPRLIRGAFLVLFIAYGDLITMEPEKAVDAFSAE